MEVMWDSLVTIWWGHKPILTLIVIVIVISILVTLESTNTPKQQPPTT